ncbi:GDSL-type esterase/lipase family protein [Mucilaginibacter ginkgonis]|uniref:T9SS type A sorting domain-containing protein n=1 Tax=Mucilaginibacter ginkgonis TaxID=2682091 RepID=A0A6I4I1K0_9SPHI|nr:GDSL-type esterase/lipase family protein [Mucilaginibacter ginkgonis]QQL50663.1 T9SS type A sorting domain-containing protein [Mucilaginibacter ginkgonis]
MMHLKRIVFFLFISFIPFGYVLAQTTTPGTPQGPIPAPVVIPLAGQQPSCSAASKFYAKDSIIITAFGASTVHGMYGYNFEDPLKQYLEHCYTGKKIDITNNGIPGETSTIARPRFAPAIAGRTGFVLILIGLNDAIALANKKMTIQETTANMRYFVKTALDANLIPIIGTIQFVNDQNNDFYKLVNQYVKQINNIYKRIAADNHLLIADINKDVGRDFSLYNADGVHPNQRGFEVLAYDWFDGINRAIEEKLLLIGLDQNFPNPANQSTTISFSLSQAGRVVIDLYNITGLKEKGLYDEYQSSGYHQFTVSTADLAPGIYIYSMQVGGRRLSKKCIVVR